MKDLRIRLNCSQIEFIDLIITCWNEMRWKLFSWKVIIDAVKLNVICDQFLHLLVSSIMYLFNKPFRFNKHKQHYSVGLSGPITSNHTHQSSYSGHVAEERLNGTGNRTQAIRWPNIRSKMEWQTIHTPCCQELSPLMVCQTLPVVLGLPCPMAIYDRSILELIEETWE